MDSENATRWTGPTACPGGAADLAERERVVRRRRVFTARRTRAAQGLNVCRAGFAGRGTASARSTDATRSRPFRPETAVRGGGGAVSASIRRRRGGGLDRPPPGAP